MRFSELLTNLMDERGETAYRLAKELDISQSTVSNWTGGESIPQKLYVKQIAEHYGISREEVIAACDEQRREKGDAEGEP